MILKIYNEFYYQTYDIEYLMGYDLMNQQMEPSLLKVKTNQSISLLQWNMLSHN